MLTHHCLYFIYDGSFEALCGTLYHLFKERLQPAEIISASQDAAVPLFEDPYRFALNQDEISIFMKAVEDHISLEALKKIYYCYLSEMDKFELAMFNYLSLGWKLKKDVDNYPAHESVRTINRMAQKTTKEAHRMMGLVRFRKTAEGIYYSEIRTDHNVLPLLVTHFSKRMLGEKWIIHDVIRGQAGFDLGKGTKVTDFSLLLKPELSPDEKIFQKLWRTYFAHIPIDYRKNHKLQRQFIPYRYEKYLTEFK